MENRIYRICEDVLKITEAEVEEIREVAKEQKEYFNPLKCATTAWQHKLGEYNENVLNKILELKALIESGADLGERGQ